jgi:hypothetical protein
MLVLGGEGHQWVMSQQISMVRPYTYGPDGMTVLPTDQYLERNDFRDTKALKLNLTFAQEEQLEKRLAWQQGKGS